MRSVAARTMRSTWRRTCRMARIRPLAIRLQESGEAYSYVPRDGGIAIVAGDESAELVIQIDQETFEGLVHDVDAIADAKLVVHRAVRHGGSLVVNADDQLLAARAGKLGA